MIFKYRGKIKELGKRTEDWITGYLVEWFPEAFICPKLRDCSDSKDPYEFGGFYMIDSDTLGIYTGKKDNDGIDIFTGDILQPIKDSLLSYIVVYDEQNCQFKGQCEVHWEDGTPSSRVSIDATQFKYCRVVGNHVDTPELIVEE